jgi:o-succinylbenzoate synthase
MKATCFKHQLEFIRPARTSRDVMQTHTIYIVRIVKGNVSTYGEAAPIPGLSRDHLNTIELKLKETCDALSQGARLDDIDLSEHPSVYFACETALFGLKHPEPFRVFESSFYQGAPIRINGLVWMNEINEMIAEARQKIEKGFTCIKFKVGAHDFDAECRMLEHIRKLRNAFQLEIRLDANGAFARDEAFVKLKELSRFDIHSIEQPIKPGIHDVMHELCVKSKIPIALDEELIGKFTYDEKGKLLRAIKPRYIILKPTLLGGFAQANAWINIAQKLDINWWATSALESNIGLNAIAQWCSTYELTLPQGLGTGSLYKNNIESPLEVRGEQLTYSARNWQIEELLHHEL